ncbi:MAG: endolytic transglycosylase MltG [Spirochaetaceae bacterium]|jgi:UPF0755 protein|nr:endolytic transglycosylase MltG [Spirochaetaceae bacterium]
MLIKKICRIAASIIAAFFIITAVFLGMLFYFNSPPKGGVTVTDTVTLMDNEEIRMEVREGESVASVGMRLEAANLIKNDYIWYTIFRLKQGYLRAGMYQFDQGLTLLSLYNLFVSGKQMLVAVMIPEGSTLKKTALIMEEAGICEMKDFLDSARNEKIVHEYNIPADTMEGYLYPDTYYFSLRYPANLVVRSMADTFYKRLMKFGIDASMLSAKDLFKKVTLASIVEREYRIKSEAPVIAGVFQNRLDRNMRLESCATVEYIISEIQGKAHPKRLFNRDIEIANPYNTYLYKGLPPGPIASPGAVALNAVFNPSKTSYLFFRVVDPKTGKHYFSETFDDHIKAGELLVK